MKSLSRVRLLATPWTAAYQAPSTTLLLNPPQGRERNGNWHFTKYQHCTQQYVVYYVGISLWVNYFVILRWRILRSIAKDYSAKSWNWNSNQNISDSKAYAISTILFLMEGGREVSLKAMALELELGSIRRMEKKGWWGEMIPQGQNDPNQTTY